MIKLNKGNRLIALVALVLAISTFLYINDSIKHKEREFADPSYKLIKLTAKSLPVKVRFASNPPTGYRLISEKVSVNPNRLVVIGPEALLEEMSTAETAIIDIGQSTRKIIKSIPIESVAGIHLTGDPYSVDVVVPIEKLEIQ
jgi:YbbR domain-containing protein